MGSGDNGAMTQSTDDNRLTRPAAHEGEAADTERSDTAHVDTTPVEQQAIDTRNIDPLDEIAAELDGLADLDPADAVPVLAEITAELNKELDADTDRS